MTNLTAKTSLCKNFDSCNANILLVSEKNFFANESRNLGKSWHRYDGTKQWKRKSLTFPGFGKKYVIFPDFLKTCHFPSQFHVLQDFQSCKNTEMCLWSVEKKVKINVCKKWLNFGFWQRIVNCGNHSLQLGYKIFRFCFIPLSLPHPVNNTFTLNSLTSELFLFLIWYS